MLSYAETLEMLRSLRDAHNASLSDRRMEALAKAMDLDGDGVVAFSEFCAAMANGSLKEADIVSAFKSLDSKGEGKITFHTMEDILCGLKGVHASVVQEYVQQMDTDSKGFIVYEEFRNKIMGKL